MNEEPQTPGLAPPAYPPAPEADPVLIASQPQLDGVPLSAQESAASAAAEAGADRPELIVAGAFAAGFLFAQILKRLTE